MKVDVVVLSNTADEAIYQMTKAAIKGMQVADETATFNVILVETQSAQFLEDNGFSYGGIHVIHPDGPFNYNRFLNAGFEHLSPVMDRADSRIQCAVICNNDLVFRRGWFHALYAKMVEFGLDVASPVSTGWPPHEELCTQSMRTIFFGGRTSYEVSGWCFLIRREALDAIRPFDERFRGEFQDCAMVKDLVAAGYGKMALVRDAEVLHLLNRSHHLASDWQEMIDEGRKIYLEKYGP